ncbi:VOC family protein [Baekduia soli]|uniref:hypothetical protein n=1 Tax=Baekduia soli TaxID=496014 RepID=UPI0016529932|nr:hypothetical protein [Baekduia soli]
MFEGDRSIEVADVDAVPCTACAHGLAIARPIADERGGVRRCLAGDPGDVVTIGHR